MKRWDGVIKYISSDKLSSSTGYNAQHCQRMLYK